MVFTFENIPFSVLDLSPIVEGQTAKEAFQNTKELAQHAEKLGYKRFWLAEHHNMPGIASSATSLLISHVAQATSTIRVGAGGVMLPNHSPLVIAEQFGTLETLYPGRIDLGLGRAPGTDQLTAFALRRNHMSDGSDFPEMLAELRGYFQPYDGKQRVRAIPGEGLQHIPIWLLGSSGFSARLAGRLGLPFAFASHFAPENTMAALEIYRSSFQPSEVLDEPHVMLGINVIAADSDEEAERLSTSMQLSFLHLIRNQPTKLQPPVNHMEGLVTEYEKAALENRLKGSIIGSPKTVKEKLKAFIERTKANELIINSMIYDHEARLKSYEIIANLA